MSAINVYVSSIFLVNAIFIAFAAYKSWSARAIIDEIDKSQSRWAAIFGAGLLFPLCLHAGGAPTVRPGDVVVATMMTGLSFLGFYAIIVTISLETGLEEGLVWVAGHSRKSWWAWLALGTVASEAYSDAFFQIAGVYENFNSTGAFKNAAAVYRPFGWAILQYLASAYGEELYCRGYVQRLLECRLPRLCGRYSMIAANLLASALFAATHFQGALKFIQIFPIGVFYGMVARKYGLRYAMIAHFAFNILGEMVYRFIIQFYANGHHPG